MLKKNYQKKSLGLKRKKKSFKKVLKNILKK